MSRLDAPIGPQSLAEEIIAVLRASGGPTLRSAIRERCKLAGSADYFSGEFGKLVLEGKVVAAGGVGPRVVYRLADSAADHKVASAYSAERVAHLHEQRQNEANNNRQKILDYLADGAARKALDIVEATGITWGQKQHLLKAMREEGVIEGVGTQDNFHYRIKGSTAKPEPAKKWGKDQALALKPTRPVETVAAVKRAPAKTACKRGVMREKVLMLVREKPRSAGDIVDLLGLEISTAWYHLKALAEEGLATVAPSPTDARVKLYAAAVLPSASDDYQWVRVKLRSSQLPRFFELLRKAGAAEGVAA